MKNVKISNILHYEHFLVSHLKKKKKKPIDFNYDISSDSHQHHAVDSITNLQL